MRSALLFAALVALASARLTGKSASQACLADDLKHRAQLQNKLAGVCVDMCKEVGAFPKCTCPDFVAPDSTPGVMTWPELLDHMDNLSEWGHGELKTWSRQASQLQKSAQLSFASLHAQGAQNAEACLAEDLEHRMQVQNKLAGVCVDMCKEVGAFPKCTCPDFVAPDSTPGVMTWPELLGHMDNLSEWGHGQLKAWNQQASFAQVSQSEKACMTEDIKNRMQFQNKLAGVCVDMCKEVGAFPKCTCPDFVAPDSTPGVMTWPELLEHMDNLSEWGHSQLKGWSQQASFAQVAQSEKSCIAEDMEHRMKVQNKLAGVCVDMCKEVGAFPKCTCPDFVAPDSTPGVMTWPELLEHMDNLSEWGHGQLKTWNQQASFAQVSQSEKACMTEDIKKRMQFQNKLAGVCVDMCKEVGAFPKCTCPDFVAPDSTPGVMTWPELLEHMDNLSEWGHGQLKTWSQHASFAQVAQSEKSCMAEDIQHRMQVQNKLAGVCVDMCKEVGAFPKCTCPDFVAPDSTPGVMTWPELLEHMDNLSEWGHGQLKAWSQGAR